MLRIPAPHASSMPLQTMEPGSQHLPAAAAENTTARKRGRELPQTQPAPLLPRQPGFAIAAAAASGAALGEARQIHGGQAETAATESDQRRDLSENAAAVGSKRARFGLDQGSGETTLTIKTSNDPDSGEQQQLSPAAEDKARPDANIDTLTRLICDLRLIVPGSDG